VNMTRGFGLRQKSHSDLRVAIVHYWFLNRCGGERVVEALCELFPQADLFALPADSKARFQTSKCGISTHTAAPCCSL